MKTLATNYTFNAATRQITFTGTIPQNLSSLLLITNVTDGIIIYNFADTYAGGVLSGNVLTLTYDTTSMSDTDYLQIFIDTPNTDFEELNETLRSGIIEIVRQLQSIRNDGGMADVSGRVRVAVETGTVGVTGSLTTLTSITNLASIGGIAAIMQMVSGSNAAAKELRNRITVS